ncbi:MAG TPA: thiamine pyrophosphate-dependent enzyme [Gaiellaceae bacterium]|nr:thiamine pyrophosphate-dependent enzyme [Gaiellaceae bacterium]
MLTVDEYFDTVIEHSTGALVVCALGITNWEWWERTRRKEDCFHVNAAMGYAASVGLGLALAVPEHTVLVLDSDGGLTMNLSGFTTLAAAKPKNLVHVVANNRCYGSLGGTALVNSAQTDYAAAARACGIEHAVNVETVEQLDSALRETFSRGTYGLVVADIEGPDATRPADAPLPMPYEASEMKYIFGRYVEQLTGRSVFGKLGF